MSSFGLALQSAWPYAAAVLIALGAVALGALIVVFIRLAKILKKTETTMDEVNGLVEKSNKELQPVLERIDPMMEKATLSIDTLNLELLRVDAILEDVESLTNAADQTVTSVEKVAAMPTDAVAGIAERVRGKIGSRPRGAHSTRKFVYPSGIGAGASGLATAADVAKAAEQGDEPTAPAAEEAATVAEEPVVEPAEAAEATEQAVQETAQKAATEAADQEQAAE